MLYRYSSGMVIVPASISFWRSPGDWPLTVQPIEKQEPRTSLTVPLSFFAIDLDLNTLAMLMTASRVMLPLCLMFLTFFLSLGGSLSSFMIIAEAVGTMEGVACNVEQQCKQSPLSCLRTLNETYHTVDDAESNHDLDTLPLHGCLLNIFTNLLGRLQLLCE